MKLDDFRNAMALLFMRRLKWSDWDAAKLMNENAAKIERHFHDGYTPLDSVSSLIGRELEEHWVSPEDARAMLDADPGRRLIIADQRAREAAQKPSRIIV